MRIVALVAAAVRGLPSVLVAWFMWPTKSPVRGEAHRPTGKSPAGAPGADGGHELRGGGLHCSRPSVPARELIDYRPAPENRYWVNDITIAGALATWSEEAPS